MLTRVTLSLTVVLGFCFSLLLPAIVLYYHFRGLLIKCEYGLAAMDD